ncbi:hypothetical protein [Streptomyces sp. NRRL F-5123]|uniref:hypothetical protein n=1 Tax=Streptomyces sp. NRRL F-5123 TaxID=1463856 RepID=UPI000A680940|nr:hypothetical protein [Streptomyces sp. NRRL F-5123]
MDDTRRRLDRPGTLALRLIDAGHPASAAIEYAGRFPSWRSAAPEALAAFGTATASLWREIAEQDHTPWKRATADRATSLARALSTNL